MFSLWHLTFTYFSLLVTCLFELGCQWLSKWFGRRIRTILRHQWECMTWHDFSILHTTTNKVTNRYDIRAEAEPSSPNLRGYLLTAPEVIKCRRLPSTRLEDNEEHHTATEQASCNNSNSSPKKTMTIIDSNDLGGFLFHEKIANIHGLECSKL